MPNRNQQSKQHKPSKQENLREESDKMVDEAKKQQNAMPLHGEPIGGG